MPLAIFWIGVGVLAKSFWDSRKKKADEKSTDTGGA